MLSAKHGLVAPMRVLQAYDVTLNRMGVQERRAWAERVWRDLEPRVAEGDRVVIFAGVRYREVLISRLQRHGCRVDVPMKGLRIGEQMRWLNTRV